jgi:hypothetical protein
MPNPTDSQQIRDSMTREVTNDAYAVSQQIFKGQEPDVARVSNAQLDERYRQAFSTGDRQYLMAEAQRDPSQFLASMQRLGVTMPPGQALQTEPKLPSAAKPNVPLPSPPAAALPAPLASPPAMPAPSAAPPPPAVPSIPPPSPVPPPAQPPY